MDLLEPRSKSDIEYFFEGQIYMLDQIQRRFHYKLQTPWLTEQRRTCEDALKILGRCADEEHQKAVFVELAVRYARAVDQPQA